MRTALVSNFCVIALVAGSFLVQGTANAVESAKNWKIGIKMMENYERGYRTGVKIVEIFDDSPAQKIGLQAGDVLHSVDRKLYNDPLAVRRYVMNYNHKVIFLIYQ